MTPSPTRNLLNIADTHTASKQGHCQEKADQQNRDQHQHPGKCFQSTVAESLEGGTSDRTNGQPPENSVPGADQQVIDSTRDGNQKNDK